LSPRRIVIGLIFLVTWGLTTHGKYSVTGDEPHYLMIAESLRADGDLDLRNNYEEDAGAAFGAASLQPGPHARVSPRGRFLSVHDVGVPILLVPVYTLARSLAQWPSESVLRRMRMNRGLFAYSIVSLALICLSTLAGAITIRALEHAGAPTAIAAPVVAIAWLAPPVLSHAFLVFPEPFAMFVTACAVWCAYRQREWAWRDSGVIVALGLLPWLHRKFVLYVAAMVIVIAWRRASHLRVMARSRQATVLALFLLPILLLVWWTWHEWGNVGGGMAAERVPLSVSALLQGLPATIVDRENGVIWWAPVYVLLPAGFWLGRRELWPWLLPIVALVVPGAAHQWWAGFSPAARFLVPLAPILCLFGLELATRSRLRLAALVFLVPQGIVTAYAWQHARLLWPQGDGENRVLAILLPPLSSAYRAIPSFRTAPDAAWIPALILIAAIVVVNVVAVNIRGSSAGYRPGSVSS
jgi:hypothetical protein